MGRNLNVVIVSGRVGSDPVIGLTQGGSKRAKFRLGIDDSYANSNGAKVEQTVWASVTYFGTTADVVERYVSKGQLIEIQGKLEYSEWTDKETGKKLSALAIRGIELKLMPKALNPARGSQATEHGNEPSEEELQHANGVGAGMPTSGKASEEDDDIPF